MSEDLQQSVEQELERILVLNVEEQPAEFSALREKLEGELDASETN
jgi:hypothetical protein